MTERQELPGERSARIVREMHEQDALDEAAAHEALRRLSVLGGASDGFPEAEEQAYVIGFKDGLREQRARRYEYKVVTVHRGDEAASPLAPGRLEETLNDYAQQGWEFVQNSDVSNYGPAVFRRAMTR